MPTTLKTKTTQKRLEAACAAFDARYSSTSQYGEQRWNETLIPALLRPTTHVALLNDFVSRPRVIEVLEKAGTTEAELRRIIFPSVQTATEGSASDEGPLHENVYRLVCFERRETEKDNTRTVVPTSRNNGSPRTFPAPVDITVSILGEHSLLSHWNMDAASILAASLLDVRPGDRVLDLCSAPGGKSIALAQSLFPQLHATESTASSPNVAKENERTCLHCNEPDPQRNKRLTANLHSYLPPTLFTSKTIKILKIDASARSALSDLPLGEGAYDKVLVDAPCSSERHILHAHAKASLAGQIADEMMNWKPSHSITLSKTQVALLTNALLAVGTGGKIMYATCALGQEENDMVVDTVLNNVKRERKREKADGQKKRWDWDVEIQMGQIGLGLDVGIPLLEERTEQTKYGRIALPDKGGWGPLYFCLMKKIPKKKVKKGQDIAVLNVNDDSVNEDTNKA